MRSDNDDQIDDDQDSDARAESSSDDEHNWKQSVKEQYRQIQKERKQKERQERHKEKSLKNGASIGADKEAHAKEPKFFELKDGVEYFSSNSSKKPNELLYNEKLKKLPLSSRLEFMAKAGQANGIKFSNDSYGNKQMTFESRKVALFLVALVFSRSLTRLFLSNFKAKRMQRDEEKAREHHLERKSIRRSAGKITKTLKRPQPVYNKRK